MEISCWTTGGPSDEKVRYDYRNREFAFYIYSLRSTPPASSSVSFTSMVEWMRSLDQRDRARLRVHQQRRNNTRAGKPCSDERRSEIGPRSRPHFLIRFIWLRSWRAMGGRWVGSLRSHAALKDQVHNRFGDLSRAAASVFSGLLIVYLRPGTELIPESRGFSTSSAALNAAIDAHAFISDALEWLCGFHAVHMLWHWLIKGTRWGTIAGRRVERAASAASPLLRSRGRSTLSSETCRGPRSRYFLPRSGPES